MYSEKEIRTYIEHKLHQVKIIGRIQKILGGSKENSGSLTTDKDPLY